MAAARGRPHLPSPLQQCSFPEAALTNDHTLGVFSQKAKVCNQAGGTLLFLKAPAETLFCAAFLPALSTVLETP